MGMPKKKDAEKADKGARCKEVRPKNAGQWMELLKKAEHDHWRCLRITIQIREKLHGGKPAALDAAKAMLAARGLSDQIEALPEDPAGRAEAAEEVVQEGLCEFTRREGKTGVWIPSHNIKAGIKENWVVLGFTTPAKSDTYIKGSKGATHEGIFVYAPVEEGQDSSDKQWIRVGDAPDGIDTSVTHTNGPTGPKTAIKRNEFVLRPRITFDLRMARAVLDRLPDEAIAQMLVHFGDHGLGANRSQGFGTFDVVSVEDVELYGEISDEGDVEAAA